jgi:hypothetical protein
MLSPRGRTQAFTVSGLLLEAHREHGESLVPVAPLQRFDVEGSSRTQ